MIFEELKQKTHEHWFKNGLYGRITSNKQADKLLDEAQEVSEAFECHGELEQQTEIGDCLTVLINLCKINNFIPEECLHLAYMKNKNREGSMSGGEFLHTDTNDE